MRKDSFTNQEARIATEKDCKASWSGQPNGRRFRCGLCGYKFKPGDYYRWQYTNDMPGAWGNPLVCKACDKGPEGVRKAWKKLHNEYKQDKFWWFRGSDYEF